MDWIKAESEALFQTYKRQPLVLVRGKGSHVWDHRGKKYLDFFAGLAVNNVGHCNPAVARAVSSQVRKLIHACNLYYTLPQIECAQELIRRTFPGKVFFSNSGAEANECAVKLARRWGVQSARSEYIAFDRSFHGRTFATLSLTGQGKYRQGFDPLLHKVHYARFNDLSSVRQLINEKTCAVFIEPIQGEGGVNPAHPDFLKGLRELCDQHRLLLVFDEIQCGLGRTGQLFAFQHYGVRPDVVTIAKGLGGGLPIGATLASDSVAALFGKGDHASTFGGNPVVCSAARAVLKTISPVFLKSVRSKGEQLRKGLETLKSRFPGLIREVRGAGLMVGAELSVPGDPFVDACRERGLLINCTQGSVLRFLPPLTISPSEIRSGLAILEKCFKENVVK